MKSFALENIKPEAQSDSIETCTIIDCKVTCRDATDDNLLEEISTLDDKVKQTNVDITNKRN